MIKTNQMNDNNNVHVNQIIFLTDRKPNKGEQNVKQILKNVQNANYNKYNILIYTFGITNDNYLDEAIYNGHTLIHIPSSTTMTTLFIITNINTNILSKWYC